MQLDIPEPESYEQYRQQLASEQATKTRDEIKEDMQAKSEFVVDLENLPKQEHRWIDRGLVMSCEGAGHPSHRHFKFRR